MSDPQARCYGTSVFQMDVSVLEKAMWRNDHPLGLSRYGAGHSCLEALSGDKYAARYDHITRERAEKAFHDSFLSDPSLLRLYLETVRGMVSVSRLH